MRAAADEPDDGANRPDFPDLVKRALDGESDAKDALVDSLNRLVWYTIAEFGLSPDDRQDVFATTFCRLFERLETIRERDRLPGWIARTARNEALSLLRSRMRLVVSDDLGDTDDGSPPADEGLLDQELRVAVRAAFRDLAQPCRELLRLTSAVPRLSYEEIGALLDKPHGSIGPTRQRCLERLRNAPELRPFLEGGQP
jgi:RNA polymerase sigma factor (sigma-70 family)